MHWFALFAIGGVTLQVPEDVSETAEVLLKPVDPGGELRESPRFWRRPIRNAVGGRAGFCRIAASVLARRARRV